MSTAVFVDPNNLDYRDAWPPVGKVISISHTPPMLQIRGALDEPMLSSEALIVVLDSAKRFVAAGKAGDGSFQISFSDRHLNISTWPLAVYAYDAETNIAQRIEFTSETALLEVESRDVPSFKPRYVEDVVAALKHSYTSVSSKSDIKTGNGYQSVDLETIATVGGRPARQLFLRHVKFKGKSVLDIGANTGELSRMARRRGAAFVDGYEYDPFFVETGRMINAITGMTRVSLFQGDATNPRLYDGMKYDLVLAFAVWVYIEGVLDRIAAVTDAVLFETHTLGHGLEMYLRPMRAHFPYFRLLGHDQKRDMRKSRAVLLFGKTQAAVDDALALVSLSTEPYFRNGFFDAHPRTTPADFVSYASNITASLDKQAPIEGLGKTYFEFYIAGYMDYLCENRRVGGDNIFLRKFREAIVEGRIDQSLRYLLENEAALVDKVTRKFADIDHALAGNLHMMPPITVRPSKGGLSLSLADGRRMSAKNIDGHHRFFIAQVLSLPTIDAMILEPLEQSRPQINTNYTL